MGKEFPRFFIQVGESIFLCIGERGGQEVKEVKVIDREGERKRGEERQRGRVICLPYFYPIFIHFIFVFPLNRRTHSSPLKHRNIRTLLWRGIVCFTIIIEFPFNTYEGMDLIPQQSVQGRLNFVTPGLTPTTALLRSGLRREFKIRLTLGLSRLVN